jgi:hypothetical protein
MIGDMEGDESEMGTPVGVWWVSSIVLPFLLAGVLLAMGFGLGTACTDRPGNGSLSEAPCNMVTRGVTFNSISQVVLGALSIGFAVRSRRTTWLTRILVLLSVVVFVVSVAVAMSY